MSGLILCNVLFTGCSTLRDSLVLGAGTGAVMGGIAGNQSPGNREENTIKGAVLGGIVGGVASYLIHGSLESRDTRVRKETLLNLEKFDVMGRGNLDFNNRSTSGKSGKCYTTHDVDGRLMSIPCRYVEDSGESDEAN